MNEKKLIKVTKNKRGKEKKNKALDLFSFYFFFFSLSIIKQIAGQMNISESVFFFLQDNAALITGIYGFTFGTGIIICSGVLVSAATASSSSSSLTCTV